MKSANRAFQIKHTQVKSLASLMADESAHREHEMDALMEASMGEAEDGREQQQDHGVDEWYQNVTERLQRISDCHDHYQPACAAIVELQEIIKEVMEQQQQGAEPAWDLFVTMAAKQEKLFSVNVEFHRKDVPHLEEEVGRIGEEVTETEPSGGYVNRGKQLLALQASQELLSQHRGELDVILEAPLPIELPSLIQQEQMGDHTHSVYGEVSDLHGRAQMLHLQLQGTADELSLKLAVFDKQLLQERERFLQDLGEVEKWLSEVYSVMEREPNRGHVISYTAEEVRTLQEEYSDDGVNIGDTVGGVTLSEQVKSSDGTDGVAADWLGVQREVSISGSSLGSDILELGAKPEELDASVDVELDDDEYQKQVMQQVLSGSSSPSPTHLEQASQYDTPVDPYDDAVDPFDDSVDPVGEQWVESMEEETDFQTETASVSSGSTLRPERSPDRKRAGEEGEGEEGEGEEGEGEEGEGEGGEGAGVHVQRERGKSLADELGELGIALEGESGEEEVNSEESEEDQESGGADNSSEEGSEVDSGGVGLHWVARLRLLPMYCGREGERVGEGEREREDEGSRGPSREEDSCFYDLDHIVRALETYSGQLQTQNHKIKSAMANINFVINASPPATAQELQARLLKVKVQWESLALRLKQRKEQLLFEKSQIDALESLYEAVRELEGQPQNNMTLPVVKESYSQLMEFFQDVESFEEQSSGLISQLESTLQPLLGQREGLLGDGKGAWHLLQNIVERIREGFKVVEDQLKLQKDNLEKWLEEWSVFNSTLAKFHDWVGHAEGVVSRECYGNDVVETDRFLKSVTALKVQLPAEEKKVEQLVGLGNTLLASVGKGTPAEAEVDITLTESEIRWYNLVEKLEARESDICKTLISWRAYSAIYHAARSFISQMTKMVGTEPIESSNGDTSLLPMYRAYGEQVKAMQVQYDKLMGYSDDITGNTAVGGRESIAMETRELRTDWERLKDNVMDSLALLQREYDDWVHHQLLKMRSLVQETGEIVARETRYVEEMPLATFLTEDTDSLLRETDSLVACQDRLAQLESECVAIDESLLERAALQGPRGVGEGDSPENTEDHVQLQATRDRYQLISEVLVPVINIFYLQLQLLQKIQEGRKVVARAMEAAGDQAQLESLLTDINFRLSDDHFEQLRSDAYDLGTVSEDCEMEGEEQYGLTLPPHEQLVQINRGLTGEIEALSDESATAKIRLQLFIEWWVEFHSNHGEITQWLEEAESRVDLLEARAESTESPLVSPVELLTDVNEIEAEMCEKEVLLSAMKATSQNIIEEFSTMKEQGGEGGGEGHSGAGVSDKVENVIKRWEEVKQRLSVQQTKNRESSSKFTSFITSFTSFCNWLCEMHSLLLDELCVAIPDRASEDTIDVHKARLKDFHQQVAAREAEFESLQAEGGRGGQWAEFLIPEETLNDLPSDDSQPESPATMETEDEADFPFEEHLQQLPYFRNKLRTMTTKWGGVQRLLRDRENQLEMCLGNMVVFLEGVDEFLTWVRNQGALDCLSRGIPADVSDLQAYQTALMELREEMKKQEPARLGLLRSAENLIGQMSGPNADKVTEKAEEVKEKWEELNVAIETKNKELADLINCVEVLLVRVGECEGVLEEGEGRMTECGPIGADLDRLVQQQQILDALDGELLTKKKLPEELAKEAMNIIRDCQEGSGGQLVERVRNLQNRFDELSESCFEAKELCEEATAEMQAFHSSVAQFQVWLSEVDQKLEARVTTKRPIGTISNEAADFLDFMKEMEQHTEQYNELHSHGNKLAMKYKPSNALDEMMSSLHQKWENFVSQLCTHLDKLHSLASRWDQFERDVKNLLNWIMDEANRFSGEVTSQGEKGIEDHIESCKVLSETLEGKKETVSEIQALAEELREEDGEKSNGTCDVDSRWNDVNQHWSCLCKLLLETLLRLEATYAEVQHVLLIRSDEFDWLVNSEKLAADQHCCHGDVGRVEEEIVRHQQLLTEVEGHSKEVEFLRKTVEFLLEHSRLDQREDIKERAADFMQRYDNLLSSLNTYVGNLQTSIPLWREFNAVSQELWEWLDHAQLQLTSDLTQPGNAIVTQTSLRNVELLSEEMSGHQTSLDTLSSLSAALSNLIPHGDKEYVCGVRDQLVSRTGDLAEQTEDRMDILEQRLRSWEVFPVAEAQAVQAFLQQVQEEMGAGRREEGEGGEEEEGEEEEDGEISYEQLLEKLKRLEELQLHQQANKDKLTAITQSVQSADVQAALERNPDISKERSNLLQGWTSMSEALSQQIVAMKLKAEMMGEVEGALVRVCEGVRVYGEEVSAPLPPLSELETSHEDITLRMTDLHDKCQTEMTSLENLFSQFSVSPDLVIPVQISARAAAVKGDFEAVAEKARRRTETIETQLELWAELKSLLPRLFRWVRGAVSELSCLRKIPDFATEFASLESRMDDLKDQLTENSGSVQRLQVLVDQLLSCEDNPATHAMREQHSKVEENWRALNEGVGALEVAVAPWKELTDRFDELQDWFDEFRESVRQNLSDLEQEDGTTDMSDYVVVMKDHLLKMDQQTEAVTQLTNQGAALLSHDICNKHQPAHDLNEQIIELDEMWAGQKAVLQQTLSDVEEKHSQWKEEAMYSIHRLRTLTSDLSNRNEMLYDKEREIENQRAEITELRQRLQSLPKSPPVQHKSSSVFKFLAMFLVFLLMVLVVLSLFLHDMGSHVDLSPLVCQLSSLSFKPI